MQCRSCGTEIADKAIVCYRCGAATTDPVRKPVPLEPTRSPLTSLIVAAVMMLIALYLGYASRTAADPERWQTIAGVLAGAAAIVIILGLVRRRRR
jgi:hypothetical protein